MELQEVVEDKKIELIRLSTNIPLKEIDILDLIDTLELCGLINDGIDKYNNRNTVQGFINNMVGNTNITTMVDSSDKATYMEQDEINDLNEALFHLCNRLGENINNANNKNNYDNTNLANNGLKSNNNLGAHIVEEKEGWFYGWAGTYDEWNNYYHTPTEANEPGSSHTFRSDSSIFKLTKTKHNGKSKKRLVSEVSTPVK